MSVTIKDVAEASGVSRGTVDRVLNNRGSVNPETEERVKKVAEELGYVPNLVAKGLAVRKNPPTIGVVLPSVGNPFFDDVIVGIKEAEQDLHDYGVKVELVTMRGYNPHRQLECISSIEDRINVLIIAPISDNTIAAKIDELMDAGIPTVTINTDIEHCSRICYVGSDYIKGGEVACGMLALTAGADSRIGILTGSTKVLGHSQRIAGLRKTMKARYPDMIALDFAETEDDDDLAYNGTAKMIADNPGMNSIFAVAGGVHGICRAIIDAGKEGEISVISFDTVPTTLDMMRRGVIKATICQKPELQGFHAVKNAFDYYVSGNKPKQDRFLIENEIKIIESL